jgi:serine/threonine protein kinase/Tfp pilus assembly protein PilF
MPLAPGAVLGPYVVVAPLGAGGMGEVYRARDTRLGRDVAVKVLPEGFSADPERLRRFENEARAAAALSHPNVLAVYDVNVGGTPCVVFELLEGETLRSRIAAGDLSPARAVDIAGQVGRGLAAAHDKGIVHRDLKPDNVFLTRDGLVKVLDFGLARMKEPPSADELVAAPTLERTEPGVLLGTRGYMSPEQVRGLAADQRSDIFALGVLLYEMLTGQRAFDRGSAAETQAAILRDDPPPPPASRPLAPGIERLLGRCLAKRPEDRFHSTRDFVFALEALSPASEAPAPSVPRRPSIAVLPFADLSPERDQEYFCDGLAEELIAALARVRALQVASRTSSFQFRGSGADVRAIAERLGVGAVLEGSVRRAGDRLRVTVQLVNAKDGYHLWSERYDRRLEDVFAIQEQIAASVSSALSAVLTERDRDALQRRRSSSLEAWELYLRGRRTLSQLKTRELRFAVPLFERAIELDPGFALAYAGLAEASYELYSWMGGRDENRRRAEEASRRAFELAPDLAEVLAACGAALSIGRHFDEAMARFEEAIRIDPQLWQAYWLAGRMRFTQGHLDEAERLWSQAMEVRPLDYQVPLLVCMIHRARGDASALETMQWRGIELARRHLAENPDDVRAMYMCAGALVERGQEREGLALLESAVELSEGEPATLYNAACTYARIGQRERALEALGSCVRAGWGNRDWTSHDPDFDAIREDPRFQAILSRMPRG